MSTPRAEQMKYPSFRVGSVLPADERGTALVRLVASSRHLLFFARLHARGSGARHPGVAKEDGLHTFLGSVVALLDTLEAFRAADVIGCFASLEQLDLPELQEHLDLIRKECEEQGGDSLMNVVTQLRNNAGAHWSPKRVARALRELENRTLPLFEGGEAELDTAVPIAYEVTTKMLEYAGLQVDLDQWMRIARLQSAVWDVTGCALAARVRALTSD